MNLPKGYLSPSSVARWESCQMKYYKMDVLGEHFMPSRALETKKKNHRVILEEDLGYKIRHGSNRADSELSEIYRAEMEQIKPLLAEDPTETEPVEKYVETEVKYFDQIIKETRPFRQGTIPVEVEKKLQFDIGGVPIVGFLDLIANETICNRIQDLKREGQASQKGLAGKNRQLVTYAIGTGLTDVGLVQIVENKKPTVNLDNGEVTPQEIQRVTQQYQGVANEIETAMRTGLFRPVDHGDKRKAWICSFKWCGAWSSHARDFVTGENVSCPWGERSQVKV